MSRELMNTKEVARYLDIHEKQVYALIKAGKMPCTRVTGKWIFPLRLIEKWIESSAHDGLREARRRVNSIEGALLASGSNDPALDMLLTAIQKDHPDFNIFSANTGSVAGLESLNSGLTDMAFAHLFDAESGDYNIPFLKRYCPDQTPVVVNLFYRQIGFILSKDIAGTFQGWQNLADKNIRFVNRQKGSGIRLIIDQELEKQGIDDTSITGYENAVYTHFEVGLSIVAGDANAGIASAAIASLMDLQFLPLSQERFDMILAKDTFFQPPVQAFIETIQSDAFKKRVEKIGHYSFKDSGRILHS